MTVSERLEDLEKQAAAIVAMNQAVAALAEVGYDYLDMVDLVNVACQDQGVELT